MVGFKDPFEEMRGFLEKNLNISSTKKKKNERHGGGGGGRQPKPPKGRQQQQQQQQQPAAAKTKQPNDPLRVRRFRNVFAKPLKDWENFVAPVHPKTNTEKKDLKHALQGNFIFDHLDQSSQDALVNAMERQSYPKGTTVITQGELGDYMYVIETGVVRFEVDGQSVGKGEPKSWFGELAILYDAPRAATVVCETDCQLWRVEQDVVRKIKAARAVSQNKQPRELVRQLSLFSKINYSQKNKIADALTRQSVKQGEVLVQKGAPADKFYLIQKGTLKASNISIGETYLEDLVLHAGECFGHSFMESGQPWVGNATAVTDGVVYWLSREDYLKIMGGLHLEDLIQKQREARLLMAIPILSNTDLDPLEIDQMVELFVEKQYKAGTVFMEEGKAVKVPAIYVIRKGTVVVTKKPGTTNKKILKENEVFGHDQLVKEAVISKHTVAAATDVTLAVLTLKSMSNVMLDINRLGKKTKKAGRVDSSISLHQLEKYNILGAGTFGQVWLVSSSSSSTSDRKSSSSESANAKTPYALKIQYKRDLIGYNQVEGVINEKNIMEMIDHPFVIGLVNSYKDDLRVYMLMQLLQGGELFGVLHTDTYDGVPEDEAVFYAANILEGLSYMHRRNIIHRDLKGENVLMDSDGYCVLIDLGFAKVVPDKTYTCCGTPIFMAPEVLLGEGHNHGADLWSLGVLIFDMIVGYTPFYVPGMTQMELYQNIVRAKVHWPDDVQVSPQAKNLIKNLLISDPSFRLGCLTRGDLDIREHAWFKEVDFGKLFRKELEAPWVPNIKDPFDVSQFDDWSELEHDQKERKPLSEKEQTLFVDF